MVALPRGIAELIDAANAARGWRDARASHTPADAEARLEAEFGASRHLAVYGTLAPGRSNHHVVAPLGGTWWQGAVHGDLAPHGWGATLGYPALHPRQDGPPVAVYLLHSIDLPDAWPRLDAFEGSDYTRILVPVVQLTGGPEGACTVANVYARARH